MTKEWQGMVSLGVREDKCLMCGGVHEMCYYRDKLTNTEIACCVNCHNWSTIKKGLEVTQTMTKPNPAEVRLIAIGIADMIVAFLTVSTVIGLVMERIKQDTITELGE